MTVAELVAYEVDNTGFQLRQTLAGFPEAAMDTKLCPTGMTAKDMVEHLCEAYEAVLAEVAGKQHEWGSYSIPDKSWANIMSTFEATRQKAGQAVTSDDEKLAKLAHDYMVAHDAYHVGQLVLMRLEAEPDWNFLAIYRH